MKVRFLPKADLYQLSLFIIAPPIMNKLLLYSKYCILIAVSILVYIGNNFYVYANATPPSDPKKECLSKCTTSNKVSCECKCNGGIVLNTHIPFIGRCILKDGSTANGWSALSGISQAISRIFMTLILTGGFAMLIWWWVQIAMGDMKGGKEKIKNVVIAFAVLWSLGIVLRLINPNFFK